MAIGSAPRRVDERVLGAGTTTRFVLLIVLMVVASGVMMADVLDGLSGSHDIGCVLAGGGDPDAGINQVRVVLLRQSAAYQECADLARPATAWWVVPVWPVLVLLAAALLFRVIPARRLRRVVPLEAVDRGGVTGRLVAEAAEVAGLRRPPRVVVDPTAVASTGATAFGSDRRPVVSLHSGLLVLAATDPERVRGVLLHELAHIRNRDITLTYATVALWRVFLGAVLIPYAGWLVVAVVSPSWWSGDQAVLARGALVVALMVVLVHLARADVLRGREVCADLAAARWGASHRTWAGPTPEPAGRWFARAFDAFRELWRTHPRKDRRRAAVVDDTGPLVGAGALAMFLTGVAATLVNSQAHSAFGYFPARGVALGQVPPLLSAGLVVGVAGTALWRAVAHAGATGRRAPSGLRAGAWLGLGLAFGELAQNRVAVAEWVPVHPEALLLVVVAGAAVVWWIGQCADLWTTTRRGRGTRLAMLAALGTAGLALWSWFVWWQDTGVLYASEWPFAGSRIREVLAAGLGGPSGDHPVLLAAVAVGIPVLQGLSAPLPVLAAVGGLWVVPLLAWAIRPADGVPRWLRGTVDDLGGVAVRPSTPALGRVLLPGLLGGALTCGALVGVQAGLHTWWPLAPGSGALYALAHQAWVFAVLVAGVVVAAVAAAVPAGPHRLPATLVAAEVAAVVGFTGKLLLASADGCVEPLTVLGTSCTPHLLGTGLEFSVMLGSLVVIGAVVAFLTAGVATVLSRLRPARRVVPRRDPVGRGAFTTRRGVIGVLAAAAVAIAGTGVWQQAAAGASGGEGGVAGLLAVAADRPVPERTRRAQLYAWFTRGGDGLIRRVSENETRVVTAVEGIGDTPTGAADLSALADACAEFERIARDAERYFEIPDREAQAHWVDFLAGVKVGAGDCVRVVARPDHRVLGWEQALSRSLDRLTAALRSADAAVARVTDVVVG
ncbi:M48 family metalloprotease [Actinosynnema sp. NPDC020468]|uniref:M48 family metalloprotease n=1 Tax=Actinosynnema sp. NPDC020468 TaxID=3154488 RepID=UPI0033F4D91B